MKNRTYRTFGLLDPVLSFSSDWIVFHTMAETFRFNPYCSDPVSLFYDKNIQLSAL
ncbi:hypothetical protein NGG61_06050 [Enterococcus casseliflavus]|uniref:hypothetical protein n=1 Tax=Enterococcus casseliflavus TaxID=37734 RepID=UPI002DB6327F|nr:hypothetical protein [Enterococcus casseliflavus]MEB8399478.1 hypothetical protein [Enterococcus casseliflavus]